MNKYKVETPYGTYIRNSKREYSHIVVFQGKILYYVMPDGSRRDNPRKDEIVTIVKFCGRHDLALKVSAKYNHPRYDGVREIFSATKIDE